MNKIINFCKSVFTYMKSKIVGAATVVADAGQTVAETVKATAKSVYTEVALFVLQYGTLYVVFPALNLFDKAVKLVVRFQQWLKGKLRRAPAPIQWIWNNGIVLLIEKTYFSMVFGSKRRIIKAIVRWFRRTLGLTTKFSYTLVLLIILMLPVLIWLAYDSLFGLNQEIAPDNCVAGEQ